jgi:glycosyltransferase involved in cell wall biosynthesis
MFGSMSVSLSMIVRNEEANLAACLASAGNLADEIVVVDTGSTDRTKEIAREHGARVFDFRWCDDFSAARNESISRATRGWIFWLDADDRIDDANHDKLRALFRALPDCLDDVLRIAREQYSTDPGVAYAEAVLLYKRGEFERAEQLLSEHLALSPEMARPNNFVGDASIHSFLTRHLRASLCYLMGRYGEAEREARLVVGARPEFGEGWLLLCDALNAEGKVEEAERTRTTLEAESGGHILSTLLSASKTALAGDRGAALSIVDKHIGSGAGHAFLERARSRLRTPDARCAAHLLSASVLPR